MGLSTPASDPAHTGVLPGVAVWRYDLDARGGAVTLGPRAEAAPGEVRRLAIFPVISLDSGDPDFGAADITWRLRTDTGVVRPRDQHGHRVGGTADDIPGIPRGLPCWMPDQWTLLDLDLSEVSGQAYTLELVAPPGVRGTGFIQDAGPHRPTHPDPDDPLAWVHMTRGTHSRHGFSRGNTLPIVCAPHGFTAVTPMTDARERRWIYQWAPDGGPRLEALTFTNCPSPWIGDRGQLQVMAWLGEPIARPMGFSHADERDGVHHYTVRLGTGVVAEVTPTSHAACFRFGFGGAAPGRHGVLVDQPAGATITARPLADGRVAIEAVVPPEPDPSRLHPDPVAFYYGETLGPATIVRATPSGWPARLPGIAAALRIPVLGRALKRSAASAGAVALATDAPELDLRVAASHLSIDQARHTLELEVGSPRFRPGARRARAMSGRRCSDACASAPAPPLTTGRPRTPTWPGCTAGRARPTRTLGRPSAPTGATRARSTGRARPPVNRRPAARWSRVASW